MSSVITVENLSKSYLINHKQGDRYVVFRDVLGNAVKNIFRSNENQKLSKSKEIFWALRDVNFEIAQGDRVGIIGRNGAGKSTLLKILSRIVTPTKGRIVIDGRVASLLEVGTGFHPELTGRENIFLNGSVLGMTRGEIKKRFDEIVDFAEIDKFLDTPVKRYSSGMYVRLAFAIAAHIEPEILIVDEVLAVGDSAFQKKCLGKMKEVSGSGRTVLFVSHQMDSVIRLCNRAILLKEGQVVTTGETEKVIHEYMRSGFGTSARRSWTEENRPPGNDIARLREVYAHDENGTIAESYDVTKPIGITMEYEVLQAGDTFTHSFNFSNDEGVNIFNTHDTVSDLRNVPREKGIYKSTMWIPANLLNEGGIVVGVAAIKQNPFQIYFHEQDAISFNVFDKMTGDSARGDYSLGFPGAVRPLCKWETVKK